MDPVTLQAIKEVGFPIVAAVSVSVFLATIGYWAMRRADRLLDHLEERDRRNDARLDSLDPKLDKIIDAQPRTCRAPDVHTPRRAAAT